MPPKTSTRRKQSRRKNFVAIPVNQSITLDTLLNSTVIKASLSGVPTEDLFVISSDLSITVRSLTAGEGPLEVGLAHSDLSVTEILENLDVSFLNPDNIIAKEQARRPVRRIGVLNGLTSEESLNHGNQTRTPIKFSIGEVGLDCWVVNRSGATLTTGAIVQFFGTLYCKWQR